MAKTFTAKFMTKTLKEHRENVLLSRERALLPATQPHVEARIRNDRMREEMSQIRIQMRVLTIRKRNLEMAIRRGCDVDDLPQGAAAGRAAVAAAGAVVSSLPSVASVLCVAALDGFWKAGRR